MIITVGNNYFDIEIDNSHRDFYYVNWLFYNSNILLGVELHIMKYNGNEFVLREILRSIFMRLDRSHFSGEGCSREYEEVEEFKRLISDSYPNYQFRMITRQEDTRTVHWTRYQPLQTVRSLPNFQW